MTMTHAEIIDEVHATILKEWPIDALDEFFLTGIRDDDTMSAYHMNLGQDIRNKYALWSIPWEPVMEMYHGAMCDCSPYHPDAVSATIVKEVWKKGTGYGNKKT